MSSNTSAAYNGIEGTGIVWAYEASNFDNPPNSQNPDCQGSYGSAVLHAYDASNISTELYSSIALTNSVHFPVKFDTPMVFNGKVYIGTQNGVNATEVDVFGICSKPGYPACFTN